MARRPLLLPFCILVFLLGTSPGQAVTPEVLAGVTAAKVAPRMLASVAKDLGAVSSAVGQTLLLPLGVLETALCPLPGPSIAGGVRNIVRGLTGPVKLVGTCLKLPLSLAGSAVGR